MTGENPVGPESFEDNLEALQERLMAENGASYARQRRSSPSTDSEPGLAHSDSRHSTPTMRTASISSSGSYSRKRASPETPPPSDPSTMSYPSKHQRYNASNQLESESQQFWTEPLVMGSPAYDFTTLASETPSMYDPAVPAIMTDVSMVAALNSAQSTMPMGLTSYDSDWDSFLSSGVHPSFS